MSDRKSQGEERKTASPDERKQLIEDLELPEDEQRDVKAGQRAFGARQGPLRP